MGLFKRQTGIGRKDQVGNKIGERDRTMDKIEQANKLI
jgi:hypothetical protein